MDYEVIISLLTLIGLEVVLGIDNIIFISILAGKLPEHQQKKARLWGILLAMIMRLVLLAGISVILKLDKELFNLWSNSFSGKDLILILGGLFLLYKSTKEIYHKVEGAGATDTPAPKKNSLPNIIGQILLLDLVFSVDSIITAIGLVNQIWVMYTAFKILALSFLLLIGFTLLIEGFGVHVPKGYVYFAMAFAFLVDVIQMKVSGKNAKPVKLKEAFNESADK